MSDPAADARYVVSHFQRVLGGDGGRVSLVSFDASRLRVKYEVGDCDECVLAPDDLAGMIKELLERRRSTIASVEVI